MIRSAVDWGAPAALRGLDLAGDFGSDLDALFPMAFFLGLRFGGAFLAALLGAFLVASLRAMDTSSRMREIGMNAQDEVCSKPCKHEM